MHMVGNTTYTQQFTILILYQFPNMGIQFVFMTQRDCIASVFSGKHNMI